jgi:hypothetical protein
MEVALRYAMMDPNTRQNQDLIKEAGVALSYNFDGTFNHRMVADYSNLAIGTGGYAAGRLTPSSTPTLSENRLRVMYQFYW